MSFSLVAHTSAGSPDGNTFTTSAINTIGANLIVVGVISYEPVAEPTISDSHSNDWSSAGLTAKSVSFSGRVRLFKIWGPSIGEASHTFTLTGTGFFGSMIVVAYSGATTSDSFDVENGATAGSVTSLQPGSITPTLDGELIVTAMFEDSAISSLGIDQGYTIQHEVSYVNGQHLGGALATKVQTNAAATNPTWSWVNSINSGAVIASFKSVADVVGSPFFTTIGAKRM